MYVCICHALNDKKVKQALENGARTPASVFRHFERQVQCGKCVPMMRSMAQDHCANQCADCHSKAAAAPAPANSDVYAYGVAAE